MLCLSLFSSKQFIIKRLLDSVFVVSGIIKVLVSVISLGLLVFSSADRTFLELDYAGYHKTSLQCKHVTLRNGKHSFYKSITVIQPVVHLCIFSSKNFRLPQSQLPVFLPNSFDCTGPIFRIF